MVVARLTAAAAAAGGLTLTLCFLVTAAEVEYVCYSHGDTKLRLRCPAGLRLLIEETRYGGSRWGACLYLEGEVAEDLGGACSQLAPEGRDCCGQTTCSVPSEPVYMPICGHNSDFLRVVYQCVQDTNVTCTYGLPPEEANHLQTVLPTLRGTEQGVKPKSEAEAKLVLQDFRRFQRELDERSRPKKTIFGYGAGAVISFFCVGTLIILILVAILIYLSKRKTNESYKCNSVRGAGSSPSDSRKEELMETMFFDVESSSSRSPSAREEAAAAQLNDAFEIDLETTPKELLSSFETINTVDADTEFDESPLPSLHSDESSAAISLRAEEDEEERMCEETNDSGVETSPGSSENRSQHCTALLPSSATTYDRSISLDDEPKPGPSNHLEPHNAGSAEKPPSVCRVILDEYSDIVEC